MGLIRLMVFIFFTYYLIRFGRKLFSLFTTKDSGSQVKGRPGGSVHLKKKQDIEDAEYEELQ
jgi:hypothetical protein